MNRGDIYLVTLDPAEGRDQPGQRPALIVSPAESNAATKLPEILPTSSGGAFVCDQPRVLDLKARNGRLVDRLPPDLLDEVMAKVAPIFA